MTKTDAQTDEGALKPISKTAWKKVKTHTATLPSGAVVKLTLPNLGALLKSGNIPNELVDAAIGFQQAEKITREMLEESFEWVAFILPRTVVEPTITEEEVRNDELPSQDLEMLAAFVARTLDIDAVGHHLGGLETNRDFRRFRDLLTIDEIAEGLS